MSPTYRVLLSKRFLPFFTVLLGGAYSDNFFRNALVFLVTFRITEVAGFNTGSLVAASAGIFILPFFLFSATGGILADRLPRHRLVHAIKLAEIALMALAWVGFATDSMAVLFTVLFLTGIQSALFGPIKYAILPNLLPSDALLRGNAWVAAGTFAVILLGSLSSGLMMAEEESARWVPVVLLTVATIGFVASLLVPPQERACPDLRMSWNFPLDTVRVLRTGLSQPNLVWVILSITWFWMLGTGTLIQLPVYAREILGGDEYALTGLLALFTLGIGVGALLRPRMGGTHHYQGPPAALVIGVSCLFLALQSPFEGAERSVMVLLADGTVLGQLLVLFALSCAGGFYVVPLYTRLQRGSDNAGRARIIACTNILNALAMTLISIVGILVHGSPDGISILWLILAASAVVTALLQSRMGGGMLRLLLWPFISFRTVSHPAARAVIVTRTGQVRAAVALAAAVRGPVEIHADPALAKQPGMRLLARVLPVRETSFDAPLTADPARSLILLPAPGPEGEQQRMALLARALDAERPLAVAHVGRRTTSLRPPVHLETVDDRPHDAHGLYDRLAELEYRCHLSDRTLLASLHHSARRLGRSRTVLEDAQDSYDYRRLLRGSYALASLFGRVLPKSERTVGVLLPNVFATPVTFFALQAARRLPAMLNYTAGPASVRSACRTSGVRHIITSRRFIEQAKLEGLARELEQDATLLWLEDLRDEIRLADKLSALVRPLLPMRAQDPNEPAVVLFTSGSEGTPKGVVLSHRNLQRNRAQVCAVLDFYPDDRVLLCLPLFHSFGLGIGLMLSLVLGLRCTLEPSPLRFREIPQQIEDLGITVFFSTNTFLGGYAPHASAEQVRSLRLVIAGAERLQPATRRLWHERLGVSVLQGYGMTEAAPAVSVNTRSCARADTTGRLLPDMEARLETIADDPQPGRGKLLLRGPNIMLGYWKADRPCVLVPPEDGWYDTGDIAEFDEGFLVLHGRVRRFAKIGGEMVSLEQVGQAVTEMWPEHRHLVCAVADERRGERLVLLTEHPQPDARELATGLALRGLPELACPKRILALEQLPLLGSGKPDLSAAQKCAEKA